MGEESNCVLVQRGHRLGISLQSILTDRFVAPEFDIGVKYRRDELNSPGIIDQVWIRNGGFREVFDLLDDGSNESFQIWIEQVRLLLI